MTSPVLPDLREPMPGPATEHAELWQRLQNERRFRIDQLAALEAETPATPRHESVTRMLRTSATAALAEVDAALARMLEGRYGLCVCCERQIDAERLAVLPMASLCMACHYNEQNCHVAATSNLGRAV